MNENSFRSLFLYARNQNTERKKKGVEAKPLSEAVHNLPLRYDSNQKKTERVDRKPHDRSFLRSRE